jgi:hypothetical protein
MYHDLKKYFWWTGMKRDIARYVLECDTCRRVKADHLRPAGNLQPLSIPEWKWENICMDFIVDRLTKLAHFILISTVYMVQQYADLYLSHIVRYHGILKTIISDRGSTFVARFWEQLHDCLGTHFICSSAYHPQMNGQME